MKIILFLIVLINVSFANADAPISVKGLPQSLWTESKDNNCESLVEFYEKIDTYLPPFVFGLFQDTTDSAAFICNSSEEKTKIVIWQRNDEWVKAKPLGCPKVIESNQIGAGGLSIKHKKINVNNYFLLDSKEWIAGPKQEITTFILETDYDGLSTELLCHNHQWYFNNYD